MKHRYSGSQRAGNSYNLVRSQINLEKKNNWDVRSQKKLWKNIFKMSDLKKNDDDPF